MGLLALAVSLSGCGGKSAARGESTGGGGQIAAGAGGVSSGGSAAIGGSGGTGGAGATAGSGAVGGDGTAGGASTDCAVATDFPALLYQGVWLCGWSGGLNHYSWLRMVPINQQGTQATATFIDAECAGCIGYFPCQGTGALSVSSETLDLSYPSACATSTAGEQWSIADACPSGLGAPTGADLTLRVTIVGGQSIECYRYPSQQCDAGFTSCQSPW